MTDEEGRVADLIREAFDGVRLDNGVGLMEAQGLDDYAESKIIADYRSQDEKNDWSAIPVSKLSDCFSSLSFLDAEGMRFHLPAYLIADLEGTFEQDVVFHLTYLEEDAISRFALLSEPQRSAVRELLRLRLSDSDCDVQGPMIEQALSAYWTAP